MCRQVTDDSPDLRLRKGTLTTRAASIATQLELDVTDRFRTSRSASASDGVPPIEWGLDVRKRYCMIARVMIGLCVVAAA